LFVKAAPTKAGPHPVPPVPLSVKQGWAIDAEEFKAYFAM